MCSESGGCAESSVFLKGVNNARGLDPRVYVVLANSTPYDSAYRAIMYDFARLCSFLIAGRAHRFKHLESIRARRRAAARCEPVKPAPPSEGDEFYIKICDVVKYAENVWENE